jgi:hypothetical protein
MWKTPTLKGAGWKQRKSAQAEEGGPTKKRKWQPTQARLELFESDDDNDIAPTTNYAPVECK